MLIFDEIAKNGSINNNVGKKFRELMNKAQCVKIACPYISEKEEYSVLNELRGKKIQIVCNVRSSGCNPNVVKSIVEMDGVDNTTVEVRYLDTLHAKVYIFDNEKVLSGSANYTPNGMGIGTIENAVYVDAEESVKEYLEWFESIWEKSNGLDLINWKDLIVQWKKSKTIGKRLESLEKKVSLFHLFQSGLCNHNINFAFWCEDDDGYKSIKKKISEKSDVNQEGFDILTDSVLNNDDVLDKNQFNKLLDIEKRLEGNFLIVFKTTPKRQFLYKKQVQIGLVFGFDYRINNKIGCKLKCDSIVTKYYLNPPTGFDVDKKFIDFLDLRIREKNEEWNHLLDEKSSYLSFSDMQEFLGF